MKRQILLASALALCLSVLPGPTQGLYAQAEQAMKKVEQVAKELNLTPQQKQQLAPILEAEAPKVAAIKGDASLSRLQKLEQLKALHDQTSPQVKSILSPEQYQQLREIRMRELDQVIRKKEQQ